MPAQIPTEDALDRLTDRIVSKGKPGTEDEAYRNKIRHVVGIVANSELNWLQPTKSKILESAGATPGSISQESGVALRMKIFGRSCSDFVDLKVLSEEQGVETAEVLRTFESPVQLSDFVSRITRAEHNREESVKEGATSMANLVKKLNHMYSKSTKVLETNQSLFDGLMSRNYPGYTKHPMTLQSQHASSIAYQRR